MQKFKRFAFPMQNIKHFTLPMEEILKICIPSAKNKKNLHCPCGKLKLIYIAHAKMKKNCKL